MGCGKTDLLMQKQIAAGMGTQPVRLRFAMRDADLYSLQFK
jgi:hypothetical protein